MIPGLTSPNRRAHFVEAAGVAVSQEKVVGKQFPGSSFSTGRSWDGQEHVGKARSQGHTSPLTALLTVGEVVDLPFPLALSAASCNAIHSIVISGRAHRAPRQRVSNRLLQFRTR